MEVRRVDPRDTEWEEVFPAYRVNFFTDPGPGVQGWTSHEFEIREAPDVRSVIEWAHNEAAGRTYIVYALVPAPHPPSSGLLTLLGHDPNRPTHPRHSSEFEVSAPPGWASVRDVTCKNVVERWLQKLHSWRAVLEIGT